MYNVRRIQRFFLFSFSPRCSFARVQTLFFCAHLAGKRRTQSCDSSKQISSAIVAGATRRKSFLFLLLNFTCMPSVYCTLLPRYAPLIVARISQFRSANIPLSTFSRTNVPRDAFQSELVSVSFILPP